jgi:deoxycytidine triphosphate deaminase
MISPFLADKLVINGKSAGASSASYDCRIASDLTLGVNPAFIIGNHVARYGFDRSVEHLLQSKLNNNYPCFSLANTIEDFCLPANVSGAVVDKSSYARVFVTALNTFFDPGFHGNATLELVNCSDQPVHIKKGDPICQFVFSWLDETTERPYVGKYQNQRGPQPAIVELDSFYQACGTHHEGQE